jgi:hypothetical protein
MQSLKPDRPLAYGKCNASCSLISQPLFHSVYMLNHTWSGIRTAENLASEHFAQILNSRVDAIDESYAFREAQHEGS